MLPRGAFLDSFLFADNPGVDRSGQCKRVYRDQPLAANRIADSFQRVTRACVSEKPISELRRFSRKYATEPLATP
jgi:hypothetical protein